MLFPLATRLQAFKVFVLGRVSLKSFRSLPGIERLAAYVPPDTAILGSNVLSVPESALLAWMSAHYLREFGSTIVSAWEALVCFLRKGDQRGS